MDKWNAVVLYIVLRSDISDLECERNELELIKRIGTGVD